MSSFSEQALEDKISRLSLSQDSIETLSLWVIQHKARATTIVRVWLNEVKKASADKRLVLFYLANDILQNGRRRGANDFHDLFQDPLRQAVTMIGGQKIQTSVERMFRIWKERRVYSNSFLKELEMLIEPVRKPQVNEPLPDFKVPLLQDALSEFAKFQAELKVKSAHLSNLRVDISNPTASLSMLKDKSAGGRVSQQFEEASQKLQDYCECLGIEVNERINILDMLKECKVFTTYRLAELQRTATDYKNLTASVKELRKKIGQRVKDLERAHSTATSDPSAKEDITDVGDMEIESDGESQADTTPQPTTDNTAQPLVSTAPGMLASPPISSFSDPRRRQDTTARPPPPPTTTYQTRQALPLPQQALPPQVLAPPQVARPGMHMGSPGSHRPRPPRFPPPSQRARVPGGYSHLPPPVGARMPSPLRGPMPRLPRPPPPSAVDSRSELHTISSSPVLYNRPVRPAQPPSAPEQPLTATESQEPVQKTDNPAPANSLDSKMSLDERLKDMMLNKKFGDKMLNTQEESTKPYSPSAGDLVANSNVEDMEAEEDGHSLPTPSDKSPIDEGTPTPNMDNPILKALYQEASPEHSKPTSLVPDYDQEENDELSTSDLKNILDQVKSSESDSDVVLPLMADGHGNAGPTPNPTLVEGGGAGAVKSKPAIPSDIKITPSLTSLLDEIFPKISKSLIDRKRKLNEVSNDTAAKILRPANPPPTPLHPANPPPTPLHPANPPPTPLHPANPLPTPPSPQFPLHSPGPGPIPRPPFEGGRFPSPRPQMPIPAQCPPARLPGQDFPHPFTSYEARPFLPKHRPEGRFVGTPPGPMPPRPPAMGMQPRMRTYGSNPRFYRPMHPPRPLPPRYV